MTKKVKRESAPADGRKRADAPSSTSEVEPRARLSREETTEAILDAAEDLFSRRDPNKVTMREIAEKAGVTHPLVHQYVGTKQDVLDAVIKRGAPRRQELMVAHPDLREAVPHIVADILSRRVHSRALLRSAMDDVEYAPFDDRLESGQMLLELAAKAARDGHARPAAPGAMDPRIVMAAMVALAFGWVGSQDWLVRILQLEEEDAADVQSQIEAICLYVADLVFPPAKDAGPNAGS